jgi:DNA-binding NarL/FixJ family response regulator
MIIRICLADDHAIVRDGLRLILQSQPNMKVVGEAADGHAAVSEILRLRPHVAVVDIALPQLNGIDATHQICQRWPTARILILSMLSASEYVVRALKAGACGYLVKGSTGTELIAAIQAVVAGHRYLSPKVSDQVAHAFVAGRDLSRQDHPLATLSPREREVIQLVAEGKSSAEAGSLLGLSPKTVETYRSRLMSKLGLANVAGLVRFAIQQGLIKLD